MTTAELIDNERATRPVGWRTDVALGIVVALLSLGMHILRGFPSLAASNG